MALLVLMLGCGARTEPEIPPPSRVTDIVAITEECALRSSGRIFCWVLLPDESPSLWGRPVRLEWGMATEQARAISGTARYGCAVHFGGEVRCWGHPTAGVLGDGRLDLGSSEEHGPVVGLRDPAIVASSATHSCAVAGDGAVLCWGVNENGECGVDGGVLNEPTGSMASRTVQPVPVRVPGIDDAVHVAVIASTSCAVTATGAVYCWGSNDRLQLGPDVGHPSSRPVRIEGIDDAVAVAVTAPFACVVHADGRVSCWGVGSWPPSPVPGLHDAAAIALSLTDICILTRAGRVRCVGDNDHGWFAPRGVTDHLLEGVENVESLTAQAETACALDAHGQVLCWGSNSGGALGRGDLDLYLSAIPEPIRGCTDDAYCAGLHCDESVAPAECVQ